MSFTILDLGFCYEILVVSAIGSLVTAVPSEFLLLLRKIFVALVSHLNNVRAGSNFWL